MNNKIIKISFLLYIGIITSCKSSKTNCDAYSMNKIPFKDSIVISQMHEHYIMDNSNICLFLPEEKTIINDTLEIKILK